MARKRIAISCGDPSGLGPELFERCLREHRYEDASFTVFGHQPWLELLERDALNEMTTVSLSDARFTLGSPEADGARLAIVAMEAAAAACVSGLCDVVVTGPIAKSLCAEVGFRFPGQTEFFAARWGGEPTMAFVGDHLRLCLVTWHIPLAKVAESVSEVAFKRGVRSAVALGNRLGFKRPRVIVCGLNPHAGEDGLLGMEENAFLNPWLEELRVELAASLEGCVPGDSAFARAMNGFADVVVALYHDQGLAPFKTVDFDSGVNVTLGLPHLRVSPDHGTGFEIAGKGVASSGSMHRAIELAAKLG